MELFYNRLTIFWLIFMTIVMVCYIKYNGGVKNTLDNFVQAIRIDSEKDEG